MNKTNNYKQNSDLFNHEFDYRPNWMARSSVINIMTITKFVIGFSKSKHRKFLQALTKKPFKRSLGEVYTVLLHCPFSAEIRTDDSESYMYLRVCCSYD